MNDDIRRRIEAVDKIKASFQNVVSTADKLGVTLLERLNEAFARVENEFKSLSEYSERKLRIAVAGKFSSGKSQFINSLIGKEIASVDSARTTCCKTVFTGDTSVDEVTITDSTGKTYSRDEYVQRSAKVSASREVFTVKLPTADWRDFEVIDTPGYDSIDEEDRQISEEAVADADVVFFLFDIGDGTIPKDSIEYLKRYAGRKQLFYLIANKADLKPEGARQTIMNHIASECDRNCLKYECVLPYCSLMPWSNEVLSKSETAQANVLNLARKLKDEAMGVVDKLVERANKIREAKIAVELKAVDGHLADFRKSVVNTFNTELESFWSKKCESNETTCEALAESVISILHDSAVENTERRASSFVRWHELKSTGVFSSDWSVYLARPTSEYDLSDEERASLSQALLSQFAEHGISGAGVVEELVELRKECAIKTIDKYRIKDEDAPSGDDALFFYAAALEHRDFCKTCDYESERRDRENSILENLNRVFPSTFVELLEEKLAKVMERILVTGLLKPAANARFEAAKALAEFMDSCSGALNGTKRGDAYVAESLMSIDILPSPIEGTVFFSVEADEKVKKGQILGRAVSRDTDAEVALCANKSGRVAVLAEQGEAVSKFSPLLIFLPDDERSKVDAKVEVVGSHRNGPGEKIVCTEAGVVDEFCVKEGETVNWCDRLMTIDINAMNRHWPIVSGHAGTVSFRVKRGSRVVKGDVLAIIY